MVTEWKTEIAAQYQLETAGAYTVMNRKPDEDKRGNREADEQRKSLTRSNRHL